MTFINLTERICCSSAGVGRTGTLIAIDILLQHISENKKVDIFGTVFKLRKQRTNMVQTEVRIIIFYVLFNVLVVLQSRQSPGINI